MKYGSIDNLIESGVGSDLTPEVGMGVTLLYWTDRTPATIVAVSKNGNSFICQADNYKRLDKNGMSDAQSYEYSPNPNGAIYKVRKNNKGLWVRVGTTLNCMLGVRERYFDYSF